MKHVHHVLSGVHGPVPTKGNAHYLVQRRVIAFHVTSAAPACFRAVTNVLGSVVRRVSKIVAKNAE
jgi:hypothetical protein